VGAIMLIDNLLCLHGASSRLWRFVTLNGVKLSDKDKLELDDMATRIEAIVKSAEDTKNEHLANTKRN